MKHFCPISSSILLLLLHLSFFLIFSLDSSIANATNIVQDTCKRICKDDQDVKYNFCIWALGGRNSNTTTTIEELGSISFELGLSKSIATKSKIEKLLNDPQLESRKIRSLKLFLEQYLDIPTDLEGGLKALQSRDYVEANNRASSATVSALACKNCSRARKRIPSLAKENDDLFQLSSISMSITKMLLESDNLRASI